MDTRQEAGDLPWIPAKGIRRHLEHLAGVLNPFRFVRTRSKREFMDKMEWVLRLSVALCFIGHGFWGVISKPAWIGLITPMGFSEAAAWTLLPWVGWADIGLGIFVLIRPRNFLLWKAFLWACFTPLLRPLAGMSWFEVPERAGNFGPPLAFLILAGGMGLMKTWWNGFEVSEEPESKLSDATIAKVRLVLQLSIALLLVGHGGLVAVAQKGMYVEQLKLFGIAATPGLLGAIGWFEIALGMLVAIRISVPLLWFVFFWKLFTESLYPFAGQAVDIFETIERWGDYGACVALILILHHAASRNPGGATP